MRRLILPMTVVLTISLAGFARIAPAEVSARDVKHDSARAANSAATYAEQERDNYIRRAQKEITGLRADIDELGVKARAARSDVRARLDADIQVLDRKWDATESKLGQVKSASVQAWKKLKSGTDNAIGDLKQSLARAR